MKTIAKGFTLIELMIVVVIFSIMFLIGAQFLFSEEYIKHSKNNANLKNNSKIEECVHGYVFVNGQQIKDEKGAGISCEYNNGR